MIGAAGQLPPPAIPSYHLEPTEPATLARRYTEPQRGVIEKLNRRDFDHLLRLPTIVVPDVFPDDELSLSPLPRVWSWAASLPKAIVVHQPSQVFGAYESGRLVRWGPVSSGRKDRPTPPGVYHLTWKARSRRSTDNADWLLNWYFNFINERGVSFHEFELPGYPASHACVRLLARDAQWLYDWGDQWQLAPNQRDVVATGSTVVILGDYAFGQPAPWRALDWWRTAIVLPDNPQSPFRFD
jgi:hypothetical protein